MAGEATGGISNKKGNKNNLAAAQRNGEKVRLVGLQGLEYVGITDEIRITSSLGLEWEDSLCVPCSFTRLWIS